MTNDLSQRILNEIENKKITPQPRWQAQLKRGGVWVLGFGCVFGAGVGIGTIASIVKTSDWDLYRETAPLSPPLMLLMLSYAWVILVAGAIVGVYYAVIHTRKGYRYPLYKIVLLSSGVAIVLGGVVFAVGIGHRIDQRFESGVPGYGTVFSPRHHVWQKPEEGRLAGRIEEVETDTTSMGLVDPFGHFWTVELQELDEAQHIEVGNFAHIIGTQTAESTFQAKEIRLHDRPPKGAPAPGMMKPNTPY